MKHSRWVSLSLVQAKLRSIFIPQFAVRQGRWKLIWGQTEEFRPNKKQAKDSLELYDLAKDPLEQRDLSNTRGDVLLKMKGFAKALAKEMKVAFQPNR